MPQISLAISAAYPLYTKRGADLVITSTYDGVHKKGSLHYLGLAADLRTNNLTKEDKIIIAEQLKKELKKLSKHFQLVVENSHFHIEYDRRA